MRRTIQALTGALIVVSAFQLSVTSCGTSPDAGVTPTPTPTPTVTSTATSGTDYNMAPFAVVTASSSLSDGFAPDYAVDGIRAAANWFTGGNLGFAWRPSGNPDDATITLSWNSQVSITEIHLFDDPVLSAQVASVYLIYSNSIDNTVTFTRQDVTSPCPDDGATPLVIAGPGKYVTKVEIGISGHVGPPAGQKNPGFSEVEVIGQRVEEAIASNGEIARYAHATAVSSEVGSYSTVPGFLDAGPYRTRKVTDAYDSGVHDLNSFWQGKATSAFVEWTFDRPYVISKIELSDLPSLSGTRFTKADIFFEDADVTKQLTKSESAVSGTLDLSAAPITATKIKLTFPSTGVTKGTTPGISDLKVTGSYAPL